MNNLYNPDVLTCLANLSNDEVFTPPEVANQMLNLLPAEIWQDSSVTFLDPACKSGVFLREIAKRLIVGLADEFPDLQQRIDHIFHKQLYGIAITELTSLLARRSVYCAKYANSPYAITHFDDISGNIRFKRLKHNWYNGKCAFCGASQSEYERGDDLESHAYEWIHTLKPEEIFGMKFDVIISNPPYQLNDGGGTGSSAIPLYHRFVEQAIKLNPRFLTMIIPSRWFAGGKGLDEFRSSMLNSKHIKYMIDYADSSDCFPGVTIAGGVNYFLWECTYQGDCTIENAKNEKILSSKKRALDEFEYFVRDNIAVEIIRKIRKHKEQTISNIVHSRNCFSLFSKEKGKQEYNNGDYVLYSLSGQSYINSNKVVDRDNLCAKYKVIMTKAMSGGNKPASDGAYLVISATMRVLKPKEVCTETYLCLGDFEDENSANNLEQYMKTKFFRFLLLQALTSINISKDKFCFIPQQDFSKLWTDEELYIKYGLTNEKIDFIESMIKPME